MIDLEKEYREFVLKLEADPAKIAARVDPRMARLLHAAIGLSTEANEILDQLKKSFAYGKPLDLTNLLEEGGDLTFFLTMLLDAAGSWSLDDAVKSNMAKLTKRYPQGFSELAALNRNKAAEMAAVEASVSPSPVTDGTCS